MIKLDKLSLGELKSLQKDVAAAIASFDKRRKAEAMEAIRAAATSHGFSLEEILGDKVKRTRSPIKPKYAHPENASVTWTGRGRKPKWVLDALASGKSLDDLAI
jgi:DNA-binding protein H-NS